MITDVTRTLSGGIVSRTRPKVKVRHSVFILVGRCHNDTFQSLFFLYNPSYRIHSVEVINV